MLTVQQVVDRCETYGIFCEWIFMFKIRAHILSENLIEHNNENDTPTYL